ncbi:MAG: ABC transporter permease, partial [Alphaproteobacteria bacterium]
MGAEIRNILWKEGIDTIRDSRNLVAGLLYALFGPLVLLAGLNFAAGQVEKETRIPLAVVGAERAPNLITMLEENKTRVSRFDTLEAARASLEGDNRLILDIPETYPEQYMDNRSGELTIYADFSDGKAEVQAYRLRMVLGGYGQEAAWLRLIARGVPPVVTEPVDIAFADLSESGEVAGRLSGFVLYFFVLAAFMGGMSIAADTTAGERERQSLQPLLAQPVSKSSLALGKWLNVVLFCLGISAVTVFAGAHALQAAPLSELGVRLELGLATQALMLLALVPLILFVTALQMAIALWSKGYREAMTYLNLLIFLPALT